MFEEIGERGRAQSYLEEQVRTKKKLMGFGHRVYKVKDPRATILQGLCERLFKECGSSPLYEVALEVESVVAELLKGKGSYPTVDFYSGIIYEKMVIETDLFTLV